MYIKDFITWSSKKIIVDAKEDKTIPYFQEREIWYCTMGCNVGYEQDGKGIEFWRPVLIVKKYNKYLFTGIPLTSKKKNFPFYFPLGMIDGHDAMAILSQTKAYSSKRLVNKIGMLNTDTYTDIKKAASEYIFGS